MPRPVSPIRQAAADALPSILTVARSEGLDAAFDADPEVGWHGGVSFRDLGGVVSSGWPAQCPPPGAVAPDQAYPNQLPGFVTPDVVSFWPWTLHAQVGCDEPMPGDDWDAQALAVLDADTPRAISRELWDGQWTGGRCLMRDAVDLTPSGATTLAAALGAILEAVGRVGTWHLPAVVEPLMRAHNLVSEVGAVLRGPGGWPISFGPGYRRTGPVSSPWRLDVRQPAGYVGATFSAPALAASECYVVGHAGPVEVAWRDVTVEPTGPFRDHRVSSGGSLRERRAIFRYSPARVFAARVNFLVGVAA